MTPHDPHNAHDGTDSTDSTESTDTTAELLTQALNEEAAMVQIDPSALNEIRRRTGTSTHPRRSWVYAGLGAAAATAAIIAGVTFLGDSSDPSSSPAPAAGKTQDSNGTPQQTGQVFHDVAITYVGPADADYRLQTESGDVTAEDGQTRAIAAVHAFLTTGPSDSDYTSGWPGGIDIGGIATSSGTIQVDLTGPAGGIPSADPAAPETERVMALQALLRTAGGLVGDTATLTYNGDPVQTVLGVDLPVTVAADDQTRALINVTSPLDQATVNDPVTVDVEANAFEGTVNWKLLDDSEAKVDEGFVTAPGGMGQWSTASIELGRLDPGTYTIQAFEYSAENGNVVNLDDKTFTVQ